MIFLVQLTIFLCPGFYKHAPLPRHLGESSHPKLVQGASIEGCHIHCGFVAIICVHPGVQGALAYRLIFNAVFDNTTIGVLRGLPAKPDCIDRQRICVNVTWRRGTWKKDNK